MSEMLVDVPTAQSLKKVKDLLKEEEAKELQRDVALNEMTGATYVAGVVALEDQVYVSFCRSVAHTDYRHSALLDIKAKRRVKTEQDETSLAIKHNQVLQRMHTLESVEASYIDGIDEDFAQRVKGM